MYQVQQQMERQNRAERPAVGGGRSARIGRQGEQAAARYLEARGYRVLDRNWRSTDPAQRGELDLVLRHRRVLVVCEVKTRTGAMLAHPAEAVTQAKLARLRRLAVVWLRENSRAPGGRGAASPGMFLSRRPRPFVADQVRIDVVAVSLGPREPFPVLAVDHLEGVA
jgi:putative endonuclease